VTTTATPAPDRRTAIEALMDAEGGRIHGLALRLCGDAEDAADLVQETFLSAWRGWDGFEGRAQAGTWLYAIATRACRRMRRRRSGAPPASLRAAENLLPEYGADIVDLPDPAADDASEGLLRREALAAVTAAVAELPEPFRLALVLKDIAELPVADVARILGLKEATVKTRVHRARLALRQALDRQLPHRPAPPPEHDRAVCLDLLQAKQEALDRGVPFPVAPAELCQRCRALMGTLDLAQDACHQLGQGALPPALRAALQARFQRPPAGAARPRRQPRTARNASPSTDSQPQRSPIRA
jgi:RNA polymerase sigma-70 factor (ECF subfamily)